MATSTAVALAAKKTIRSWKCLRCDKDFKAGQWVGCGDDPTLAHVVEQKTYYAREERLQISVRPDKTLVINGHPTPIPGKMVFFLGGVFLTDDPETQEVLDRKTYLLTREQYEEARLSEQDKLKRTKSRLAESNMLLEKTMAELNELRDGHGKQLQEAQKQIAALQQSNDRLAQALTQVADKGKTADGEPKSRPVRARAKAVKS